MSEASQTAATLLQAADKADDTANNLVPADSNIKDVAIQLRTAKRAIKDAVGAMNAARATTAESIAFANASAAGSSNFGVFNAIGLLQKVDADQVDDINRLLLLDDEIDRWLNDLISTLVWNNEGSQRDARSAAGTFRAHARTM